MTSSFARWSPPMARAMRARTVSAWARARREPRVPMRIGCMVMVRLSYAKPAFPGNVPTGARVFHLPLQCPAARRSRHRDQLRRDRGGGGAPGRGRRGGGRLLGGPQPDREARPLWRGGAGDRGPGSRRGDRRHRGARPGRRRADAAGAGRHRRDRRARAGRRGDGRAVVRQGHGAGARQAAGGGQPPGGPRRLRPADGGRSPIPSCCCWCPAAIASCSTWPGSAPADGWARPSTTRRARRSTRSAAPWACPIPPDRRWSGWRRAATPRAFPCRAPCWAAPGCDFSFSGLKTAAARLADGLTSDGDRRDLAAAVQAAIARQLVERTGRAMKVYLHAHDGRDRRLVVAGGVAANGAVRAALRNLAEARRLHLRCPAPGLLHRQRRHDRPGRSRAAGAGTDRPRWTWWPGRAGRWTRTPLACRPPTLAGRKGAKA